MGTAAADGGVAVATAVTVVDDADTPWSGASGCGGSESDASGKGRRETTVRMAAGVMTASPATMRRRRVYSVGSVSAWGRIA